MWRSVSPPAWVLIAMMLMVSLHNFLPGIRLIPEPYHFGGLLLLLMGLGFNIWEAAVFAKRKIPIEPSAEPVQLVSDGLYRYTRNPMYFGMVLMLTGLFVLLGSLTPVLVIPGFVWIISVWFILPEEQALTRRFGETYTRYQAQVRRWL